MCLHSVSMGGSFCLSKRRGTVGKGRFSLGVEFLGYRIKHGFYPSATDGDLNQYFTYIELHIGCQVSVYFAVTFFISQNPVIVIKMFKSNIFFVFWAVKISQPSLENSIFLYIFSNL